MSELLAYESGGLWHDAKNSEIPRDRSVGVSGTTGPTFNIVTPYA